MSTQESSFHGSHINRGLEFDGEGSGLILKFGCIQHAEPLWTLRPCAFGCFWTLATCKDQLTKRCQSNASELLVSVPLIILKYTNPSIFEWIEFATQAASSAC